MPHIESKTFETMTGITIRQLLAHTTESNRRAHHKDVHVWAARAVSEDGVTE